MMVTWIFLFVLLLVLLILFFLKQLWSRRHLPPGPLALPLIGTLWSYGLSLREDYFRKHVKQYGDINSMWIGNQLSIILSGFKAVKEGLDSFPEELSTRTEDPFFIALGKRRGIVLSNGHTWKQQRRIGMTSLRKLGLGKKSIEHQIEDGAQRLVESFRQTKGQPFDPTFSIQLVVSNVICSLSFGHQFAPEDENLQKLIHAFDTVSNTIGSFFHLMYIVFPRLMSYLPGPHMKAAASVEVITSFAKQEIEKHKEFHSLHEPQDFIDYYLLQMEKSKNDPDSTYNEDNLTQCIFDLFGAGTETTLAALRWALLLLTNHPDIQEKVQKEIEGFVDVSGAISYQDRKMLPFTNAVIHELQRVKYVFLFGAPKQCTKDVKIRGYHIPKGTVILPDLRSVLLDPEQWETPDEFNPNHFLDKDGKFIEREGFLPFGIGQRICLGEQLARIETFILLTSLLRAFNFRLPEGVKELNEEPIATLIMHPRPYKLCAVPTQA